MKNHTILFVSPVPRIPTQGRDKQRFMVKDPKTGEVIPGKSLNKTRADGTTVTLPFLIDHQRNKYITGLDELIPNPFFGLKESEVLSTYNLSSKWSELIPKIITQPQISRQTHFEIVDGVDPDFYTSSVKHGTMFSFKPHQLNKLADQERSYISQFNIVLFDRPNRFVDDTPRQKMAIQLIKNHPSIAPNRELANPAEHLFYISEENEAEMEKMRKQDILDAVAHAKYELINKSSEFLAYKVVSLLTNKNEQPIIKGAMNRDGVKQALNNYINDRSSQMENIRKFNDVLELLKTPEGKQRFEVKYLVQQALNTGVMRNSDGFIVWVSRSATQNVYKWTDYERLINFILADMVIYDPMNEDPTITNWYGELFKEVKSKQAWVE